MKLFAPKNNWDLKSPGSWWPLVGTIQTSAGVQISEDSALSLTAFSCGVRVISETLASLPCNLLEQVDYRTTKKATGEPLHRIVHDQPNPEQDSMQFLDSQVSLMVGWGNAYAEIERQGGEVVALWPIHPSRIPVRNICRNGNDVKEISAGEPGEIVYYVNNDDGTATPIAARDMLHVAGVLSRNGITGRSVVHLGKNALGIAQATEDHAGAFFRNGANPNIAIKHPKTVGKEAAERLRTQWQSVFGGVKNHYKALLLEEGMEAQAFTFSPEATQLILARQFSVTETSRLLRIPPHMLMDLTRATFSNIEAQGQELITYSLMPWIVRWEKAMYRQLLTDEQKKKYRFKFNVMGLLRGDQAARSQFYQAGFGMGVFSPNDIRELEDMNPVPGGDQRFVPANNLVPLTQIGEMAQAQIDKTKAETERAQRPDPVPQPVAQEPDSDDSDSQKAVDQLRAEMLVMFETRDSKLVTAGQFTDLQARIDALPDKFTVPLQETLQSLRESLESLDQSDKVVESVKQLGETLAAGQRAERQESEARTDALIEGAEKTVKAIAEALGEFTVDMPKALEESQKPLVDALNSQSEAISAQKTEILAAVQAVPGQIVIPEVIAATPDTESVEALAVREAELARRQDEMNARLTQERAASQGVLVASLKVQLEKLAEWESKALAKAVERPKDYKSWREKFYPRFSKQFAAVLAELEPFAAQIGVILSLEDSAERYSLASITDLKTLDEFADDNWHDRLREGTDTLRKSLWTDRPQAMAVEMVEQGKQRFAEKNHAA